METEKKPTPISFRPKEQELDRIKLIQERKGCSQAGAIRFALEAACEALESEGEPQRDQTEEDWKARFFEEKERNESLSDRLIELSGKVADSLQAAQMLHGAAVAESKALEGKEANETRKSRWQRLKDAWRG